MFKFSKLLIPVFILKSLNRLIYHFLGRVKERVKHSWIRGLLGSPHKVFGPSCVYGWFTPFFFSLFISVIRPTSQDYSHCLPSMVGIRRLRSLPHECPWTVPVTTHLSWHTALYGKRVLFDGRKPVGHPSLNPTFEGHRWMVSSNNRFGFVFSLPWPRKTIYVQSPTPGPVLPLFPPHLDLSVYWGFLSSELNLCKTIILLTGKM